MIGYIVVNKYGPLELVHTESSTDHDRDFPMEGVLFVGEFATLFDTYHHAQVVCAASKKYAEDHNYTKWDTDYRIITTVRP